LGEDCVNAIKQWLFKRTLQSEYVFSRKRTPLQSAQVGQIVRRACLAAGVRSLGSHSLRHRKGHQLADSKIAPSIAATALGHSNVHVTLEHYYPADFESAEEALRELVTDTSKKTIIKFKTGS
jgi:integrase